MVGNQIEITLAGFVIRPVKMPFFLLTRHFVEQKLSAYCEPHENKCGAIRGKHAQP
jgi:hypothetical protein